MHTTSLTPPAYFQTYFFIYFFEKKQLAKSPLKGGALCDDTPHPSKECGRDETEEKEKEKKLVKMNISLLLVIDGGRSFTTFHNVSHSHNCETL